VPCAEELAVTLHVDIEAISENVLPGDTSEVLRETLVIIARPHEQAERLTAIGFSERVQNFEAKQTADLVVVTLRKEGMDDAGSVGSTRQILNELNEENFDREMQRDSLNGVSDRRFTLGGRANVVFAIVNDLLKVNAECVSREVELLSRRVDEKRADVNIGLLLEVFEIAEELRLSQKLLNFTRLCKITFGQSIAGICE